jgi:hypothetical protein
MQTVGIVSLTLLINGSTSGMVYKTLNVYPDNPFRPMLATQGLRNLQIEMEKVLHKMKGHWFHGNAAAETIEKLMPNFVEAVMYDGDLIDVQLRDVHSSWKETITSADTISPQRAVMMGATGARDGLKAATAKMRVDYSTNAQQDHHKALQERALEPDAYCQIGVQKGNFWEYGETDVVQRTKNPRWPKDDVNRVNIQLPADDEGDKNEQIFLYVHLLDNDYGDDDDYLGEGKLNITDLIRTDGKNEIAIPLTPCTHIIKKAEFKRTLPVAVTGNVTVRIECADNAVKVILLRAENLGTNLVMLAQGQAEAAKDPDQIDHGDDDHGGGGGGGGGHGHGDHDTIFLLQNVRRWIAEAEVDGSASSFSAEDQKNLPEFAMYEVLLSHMKHSFHHAREQDLISLGAINRLSSAIGVAYDINSANIDSMAESMSDLKENYNAPVKKMQRKVPAGETEGDEDNSTILGDENKEADFINPITAAADYIELFVDEGAKACANVFPADYFEHHMISMEVLFAFIEQLKDLEDTEKVGAEFTTAVANGLYRLQLKLANLQLQTPNSCKAIHTVLAFRTLVAEFHSRLQSYGEQGFFTDTYVEQAALVADTRRREVDQYLHIDIVMQMFGLMTCNLFAKDHPIISCYLKDMKHVALDDSMALKVRKPDTEWVEEEAEENPIEVEDPIEVEETVEEETTFEEEEQVQ